MLTIACLLPQKYIAEDRLEQATKDFLKQTKSPIKTRKIKEGRASESRTIRLGRIYPKILMAPKN